MKIAYYMPFKPMGHKNPSGDLITGTEIHDYLAHRKHAISLVSKLRCRWIYYRPHKWFQLLRERYKLVKQFATDRPDLWLSYHSYYKAPDLLGASCCKKLHIPYVIFQGIYSTKRRKQYKTLPGFLLNREVLLSASHIFTNKKRDLINLKRILPEEKLTYIAPGIHPELFCFSEKARQQLRTLWQSDKKTVIMTAAMMRSGVKTEGLARVIEACATLIRRDLPIQLIIAGDGENRNALERIARDLIHGNVRFVGKIDRKEMHRYYSAADIFAFPGIEESLGMVYLEAQSCNLPVVAYQDWGGGEAVVHNETGLLSPASHTGSFTENIQQLILDTKLRNRLAGNGGSHVRHNHNLASNYNLIEQQLIAIVEEDKGNSFYGSPKL